MVISTAKKNFSELFQLLERAYVKACSAFERGTMVL